MRRREPLDVTVLFAPDSALRETIYPPATPIVYAPRPKSGQPNEPVECVVQLLLEKCAPTVRIVGADFWEDKWWDCDWLGVPGDELQEAPSRQTEEERVLAVWDKAAQVARRTWCSSEERVADAKSRVTFTSLGDSGIKSARTCWSCAPSATSSTIRKARWSSLKTLRMASSKSRMHSDHCLLSGSGAPPPPPPPPPHRTHHNRTIDLHRVSVLPPLATPCPSLPATTSTS